MSRTKYATRNIIWGWINKSVNLLMPFICRTVIIYEMGAEFAGIGGLFGSVLQVLSLAELGFATAIVYSMYKPLAENDKKIICALLNFYKKVYHIIGCVVLIIGIAIIPFLRFFIKGQPPQELNIYYLYAIYLFNSVISYFLYSYKCSLLIATQRNDIICKVGIGTTFITYMLQITIIVFSHNYYAYVIVMPILTIANNLINAYIATKLYPDYKCEGDLGKKEKEILKTNTSSMFLCRLGDVTRDSLDNIVISAMLGLHTLTMFQNYYYIQNSITTFITSIVTAIFPSIGNSIATESVEKNYADFKKFDFMYMLISSWAAICLVCLYQPAMRIWVQEDLMFPMSVMVVFVIYFYARKVGDIGYTYKQAAGLWKHDRWRPIVESVVNLILNLLFVKWWGVVGALLSSIFSLIIITFGWGTRVLFKYYFKRSAKEYLFNHLYYLIVTIVGCAITYRICLFVDLENEWYNLFVKLLFCIIFPAIYFIAAYFWKKEYKLTVIFLKNMIKNRRQS